MLGGGRHRQHREHGPGAADHVGRDGPQASQRSLVDGQHAPVGIVDEHRPGVGLEDGTDACPGGLDGEALLDVHAQRTHERGDVVQLVTAVQLAEQRSPAFP